MNTLRSVYHTLLTVTLASASLFADVSLSDLTYTNDGSSITITDCSTSASGALDLPSTIDGLPVTVIGNRAFKDCKLITSVTLNANLTTIGEQAFRNCTEMVTLAVPEGVTEIKKLSCHNCVKLSSVSLPESLTTLGSHVFYNCDGLTTTPIPSSITEWSDALFFGCDGLENVVVPEGVTSLGNNAFALCSNMRAISIPSTLQTLVLLNGGNGTVYDAYSLEAFIVAVGNPNYASRGGLLYDKSLTTLHQVPPGIEGTLTIDNATTAISSTAFQDPPVEVTSIHIGSTLTSFDPLLVEGMTSLTSFSVENDGEVGATFSVNDGVLFDVTGTSLLRFPPAKSGAYTIPRGVTSLAENAFYDCASVVSVVTPASLQSIGAACFKGARSLQSAILNGVFTEIPAECFRNCDALTAISFGTNVTELGDYCFSSCGVLSEIDISNVSILGVSSFFRCQALSSITLSDNITIIPDACFDTTALTEFVCSAELVELGDSALADSAIQSITFNDKLETVGRGALQDCESLTELTVPGTITSLGDSCFSNIGAHFIKIEEGVTTLSSRCFSECSNLQSILLPASLTTLTSSTFSYCEQLNTVLFSGNEPATDAGGPGSPGGDHFEGSPEELYIYYYSNTSGWEATFEGKTTFSIDISTTQASEWMVSYAVAPNSDLNTDSNQDGVSLLEAYALNLNPNDDNSSNGPDFELSEGELELRYYAGNSDVVYTAEVSNDLENWSSAGVSLSPLDGEFVQTASVSASETQSFMRLAVKRLVLE